MNVLALTPQLFSARGTRWLTYFKYIVMGLILVSLVSACSTVPKKSGKYKGKTPQNVSVGAGPNRAMAVYAMRFLGTPYHYGGSSPSQGFDCSGLVQYSAKKTLNVNMPRRASEQGEYGKSISLSNAKAGDLLFFDVAGKNSHVGIYLGQTYFVHAPSSNGSVRVEDYSLDYWQKRFSGARRVR